MDDDGPENGADDDPHKKEQGNCAGWIGNASALPPLLEEWAATSARSRAVVELGDVAIAPSKEPLGAGVRIYNDRDLLRSGEEILVDEEVVLGEEDAESRMAVVPADDPLTAVISIEGLVDMGPRIVGEGDPAAGSLGFKGRDDVGDDKTPAFSTDADENPADLGIELREAVVVDLFAGPAPPARSGE
jgi:hypothetical protein